MRTATSSAKLGANPRCTRHISNLQKLSIWTEVEDDLPPWEPDFSGSPLPPTKIFSIGGRFYQIRFLVLQGPLCTRLSPSLSSFLSNFRYLKGLELWAESEEMRLGPTLENAPFDLEHLRLTRYSVPTGDEDGIVDVEKHLCCIKTLELGNNILSPWSYSDLRKFIWLEEITIEELDHAVTARQLYTLLDARTRPYSLKQLVLNNIYGKIGTKLESFYTTPPNRLELEQLYGWETPQWFPHFSFDEAYNFYLDAQESDIQVGGSFLRALEVELCIKAFERAAESTRLETAASRQRMDLYWKEWSEGLIGKTRQREQYWQRWSRGELGRVRLEEV